MSPESTRPRIAFVTSVYDEPTVGGSTFVRYLRGAVEEGCLDMVFFSDAMTQAEADYEWKVHIPDSVQAVPAGWIVRSRYYREEVRRAHHERPFDVVWHNNLLTSAFDVLRETPLPVVGMINDSNHLESRTPWATAKKFGAYRGLVRFGWRQIERPVARRLARVVVNSRFMERAVVEEYGIDSAEVSVLYKAVDVERFASGGDGAGRGAIRSGNRSPDSDRPMRVLFAKSDYVRGGLWDLFEALASLDFQARLTVVGPDGKHREKIRRRARELGVDPYVECRGTVSHGEMPRCYAAHDVLCVPSRSEALGVVFMEALAAGIPAVGTRVGGIPEVLDGGRAGWLAEPQDPVDLREVLEEVGRRPDRVRSKVAHGREHVREFSTAAMVERVNSIAIDVTRASVASCG